MKRSDITWIVIGIVGNIVIALLIGYITGGYTTAFWTSALSIPAWIIPLLASKK